MMSRYALPASIPGFPTIWVLITCHNEGNEARRLYSQNYATFLQAILVVYHPTLEYLQAKLFFQKAQSHILTIVLVPNPSSDT